MSRESYARELKQMDEGNVVQMARLIIADLYRRGMRVRVNDDRVHVEPREPHYAMLRVQIWREEDL